MIQHSTVEERVRIFGGEYIPPDMKVLLRLEDLIDRHFKETGSTEFYAAQLNMSYFRLNEICRREVLRVWRDQLYEL